MSSIQIDLQFYNEAEKAKIKKNYPKLFKALNDKIGMIEVPLEDFKTYFLFRHQCEENPETFADFSDRVRRQWGYFTQYYKYDSKAKTLLATRENNNGAKEISESLGVAGALSISSKLFVGNTQADWRKIPEQPITDFDFKHKSAIDTRYLIVESKGSMTSDNATPSAVSFHKQNIINKKKDQKFIEKYTKRRNICYGIITVADPNNILKAWIVDPESENERMNPIHYRLLSRMYFYNDFIRLISEKSYLSLVLPNRIKTLAQASNYLDYDKSPLINYRFKKLQIRKQFINTHTRIIVNNANTVLGYLSFKSEELLFLGLDIDLIRIIINQRFEKIINYKKMPFTSSMEVKCVVPQSTVNMKIKNILTNSNSVSLEQNHYHFSCIFNIHINSAGIYFGTSNLKNIT